MKPTIDIKFSNDETCIAKLHGKYIKNEDFDLGRVATIETFKHPWMKGFSFGYISSEELNKNKENLTNLAEKTNSEKLFCIDAHKCQVMFQEYYDVNINYF